MRELDRLRRLGEFGVCLHAARSVDDAMRLGIEALRDLVSCDIPVVSVAPSLLPYRRFTASGVDAGWERYADESLRHAHEDPVYTARLRLLLDGAASATAMVPERELVSSDLYEGAWKPMRIRRLARCLSPTCLAVTVEAGRLGAREFTSRDTALVETIARQVEATVDRLARAGNDRVVIGGKEHPVQRFSWLVADTSGRILRGMSRARSMLRECLGAEARADRMPRAWFEEMGRRARGETPTPQWYRVGENGHARSVSVHVAPIRPTPDEFSIGFLEHPRQADPLEAMMAHGLTARESEVLRLIAEGMSNAEIGVELGISALTAKKHLENVYHKLGVTNRTAAAAAAIEAMRGGSGAREA